MALTKGKKILLGIIVGIVFIGIVAGGVYVANTETSKNVKQDLENNDYYKNLNDDEKKDFDDKLNKIVSSGEYKSLDKTQKEELVDKFVESEKIQKEMAEEVKTSDEVKTEINDLNNNLDSIKNELESLKQNGASDEEISQMEQKQQECEDQIKSAEQEKAYLEVTETAKESISSNSYFQEENGELTIYKIKGIYWFGGTVMFNADFIKTETIGGVQVVSVVNQYCNTTAIVSDDVSYEKIIEETKRSSIISVEFTCENKNAEAHGQIFDSIKDSVRAIKIGEDLGYEIKVIESWESNGDKEHPFFLIQSSLGTSLDMIVVRYNSGLNQYYGEPISKICPEFWAQLEKENAAAQSEAQNEQMNAKNIIQGLSTKDSSGNLTGFDWAAYKNLQQKTTAPQQTKTSAPAPDFSFDLDSTLCL